MTEIKFSNIKGSFIYTNSHSKTAKWVLKMYFNLGVKEICCVNIGKVMGALFCVPLYFSMKLNRQCCWVLEFLFCVFVFSVLWEVCLY